MGYFCCLKSVALKMLIHHKNNPEDLKNLIPWTDEIQNNCK